MVIFDPLEQYYFERDVFAKTVRSVIPNLEDIIADRGSYSTTDDFIIAKHDDEFYIIYLPSGIIVNWYKNLGRTNTCNKELSLDEFKQFLIMLKDNLEDMEGIKKCVK